MAFAEDGMECDAGERLFAAGCFFEMLGAAVFDNDLYPEPRIMEYTPERDIFDDVFEMCRCMRIRYLPIFWSTMGGCARG